MGVRISFSFIKTQKAVAQNEKIGYNNRVVLAGVVAVP